MKRLLFIVTLLFASIFADAQLTQKCLRPQDTIGMFMPYLKKTDTAAMLSPYARTASLPSMTGKVSYTDTGSMLNPYLRKADTANNVRNSSLLQVARFKLTGTGQANNFIATDTSDTGSPYAAFVCNRTFSATSTAANAHGFKDNSIFSRPSLAYCPFDSRVVMAGTTQDHLTEFQAMGSYNGGSTLGVLESFASAPDVSSGTITNIYGYHAFDFSGFGGATNHYAIYIEPLTKASKRWAIYSTGTQPSFHQGNVKIGGRDTNTRYNLLVDTSIKAKYIYASNIGTDSNADLILVRNKAIAGYITNDASSWNTVYGLNSLPRSTTGNNLTAIGEESLFSNTTGGYNTAVGSNCMLSNTTGNNNTASGVAALYSNTTGVYNAAFGRKASQNSVLGNYNSSFGGFALQRNYGNYNTSIGYNSGGGGTMDLNGDNNIYIGYNTMPTSGTDANTLNIGNVIFGLNVNNTGDPFIGINTRTPVSMLDAASTSNGSTPYPRLTTAQRLAITGPKLVESLGVWDTQFHKLFFWDGSIWQAAW